MIGSNLLWKGISKQCESCARVGRKNHPELLRTLWSLSLLLSFLSLYSSIVDSRLHISLPQPNCLSCSPLANPSTSSRNGPSRPLPAKCALLHSRAWTSCIANHRPGFQGYCPWCWRWHWPAPVSVDEAQPPCHRTFPLRYQGRPWCSHANCLTLDDH